MRCKPPERCESRHARRAETGFTLVELLVVIGVIGVLIAVLLPALSAARRASQRTVCAANLRQVGVGLQAYLAESRGLLPHIEEPVYATLPLVGSYDWTADPTNPTSAPLSYFNVMKPYVQDYRLLVCPAAIEGYPRNQYRTTYRIAAANNGLDGVSRSVAELVYPNNPAQAKDSAYNLKLLNGRKYKLVWANPFSFYRIERGAGLYYVMRDFVTRGADGTIRKPHPGSTLFVGAKKTGSFNQLRLDFSVTSESSLQAESILAVP